MLTVIYIYIYIVFLILYIYIYSAMKLKRSHIITLAVCLLIAVAIMSEAHYHSSVKKIREGHDTHANKAITEHIAQHHNYGGNTTPMADTLRDRAEALLLLVITLTLAIPASAAQSIKSVTRH